MSVDTSELSALASALYGDTYHLDVLQATARTARAIFGAAACSIFRLDADRGDLVFEATAGAGEERLVGHSFPASRGIAGWVASSATPMLIEDLTGNPTFARDIAESTGYVPSSLMAAPLVQGEQVIGVLEVLDFSPLGTGSLAAYDLLTLIAHQAETALQMVLSSRAAHRLLAGDAEDLLTLLSVANVLHDLPPSRRRAGLHLLGSLRDLLADAG